MSAISPIGAGVCTAAGGVFAPGHLGELTRYLPFELVDDVLALTGTVQRRLRMLPSRTGVYFVLALALFPGLGYARIWSKLCAGLVAAGMVVPAVSEKALRELRRRLGPAPLKALFEVIAGPLGQPKTPGVCFGGLRTVAFDGLSSLRVPDTERNRGWLGRIRYRMGFAGYPTLRLMCLAETGTRGLLGAAIGTGADRDEASLARRLMGLLRPGMLLLGDRAFDTGAFLAGVDATGAKLLVRGQAGRKPVVLGHCADGSYLSVIGELNVRIIEADIDVRGMDGTHLRERYRLITTLLDAHRFPASALVRLYHERWEIESAYLALRHTMLAGHVLRSGDRPGLEQEVWALLTLYQLLRMAMVDAVESRPGTDPDRASFTTALQAARDQLILAPSTCDNEQAVGVIGRAVLASLLPARRPRTSTRKVKCATSRYLHRDDGRPLISTKIVGIDIGVHTPALTPVPLARKRIPRAVRPRVPRPPTRRDRVVEILASEPRTDWSGKDLAQKLQVRPHNMLTQLAEWTRLGFITRTGAGTYALHHTAALPPARSPAAASPRDGDEERGKVQRPQRSEDERPCPETSAVHDLDRPRESATRRAQSWTSPTSG